MNKNQYFRDYYRNRYQTDEKYREKKKKYELDRLNAKYVKRTLTCQRCKIGKNINYMKEIEYEYDVNNFFCPDCNPINCPDSQVQVRILKSSKKPEGKTLTI
jgi:hypothetical protein